MNYIKAIVAVAVILFVLYSCQLNLELLLPAGRHN